MPKFLDTPEATSSGRSPILEENARLHRRNSRLFGVIVYTYFVVIVGLVVIGIKHFF